MLDGKSNGLIPVVSVSGSVGETNCSQVKVPFPVLVSPANAKRKEISASRESLLESALEISKSHASEVRDGSLFISIAGSGKNRTSNEKFPVRGDGVVFFS